jgi:hypothetical protein
MERLNLHAFSPCTMWQMRTHRVVHVNPLLATRFQEFAVDQELHSRLQTHQGQESNPKIRMHTGDVHVDPGDGLTAEPTDGTDPQKRSCRSSADRSCFAADLALKIMAR